MLSMLGKNFSRRRIEIFLLFWTWSACVFFVPRLFEEKRRDTVFGFPWCVVHGAWHVARGSEFLVGTLSP